MVTQSELQSSLEHIGSEDFEQFVALVWSEIGWSTRVTSSSQDRGIDIIATKSGVVSEKIVIQAKCYSGGNKVGRPEVQQYNTLQEQEPGTDAVIIVTSSGFTSEAISLAKQVGVKCVNGEDLAEATLKNLSENKLNNMFRSSTESSQSGHSQDHSVSHQRSSTQHSLPTDDLSVSEKNLSYYYKGYFQRLSEDLERGKTRRFSHLHLDSRYSDSRVYSPSFRASKGEKYVVCGDVHKIKFSSDSADLWRRFQKTAKKYGWEIISTSPMGVGEAGIRMEVSPDEADTYIVSVDTENRGPLNPRRQAKITSMIVETVFNESLHGIVVSDGVSGLNTNRHSQIIK